MTNPTCEILFQWLDLICEQVEADEAAGRQADANFVVIAASAHSIRMAATKSNYLARRIYGGEEHRTVKCPEHDGHWSGYGICTHGCSIGRYDITGWLPDDNPPIPGCGHPQSCLVTEITAKPGLKIERTYCGACER